MSETIGLIFGFCVWIAIGYGLYRLFRKFFPKKVENTMPDKFGETLIDNLEKRVLIDYVDGSGNETSRGITIKRVDSSSGDWRGTLYLDSYCQVAQAPRTFRADRIKALTVVNTGEVVQGGQAIRNYLKGLAN